MAEFSQRYRLSTDHTYARQPLPLEKIEALANPEMQKKRRGGTCCCVKGCSNREGIGVSFHRFPTDKERRDRWIKAIKREGWRPNTHTRICGDHFIAGKSEDPNSTDFVPSVFKVIKLPPTEKTLKRKAKMEEKLKSEVQSVEYSVKPVIIMSDKPDNVVVIGPNHIVNNSSNHFRQWGMRDGSDSTFVSNYSRDTRGLVRSAYSTAPIRPVIHTSKSSLNSRCETEPTNSDLSHLSIYKPNTSHEDTKSAALALLQLGGPCKEEIDDTNLTHPAETTT